MLTPPSYGALQDKVNSRESEWVNVRFVIPLGAASALVVTPVLLADTVPVPNPLIAETLNW